MKKSKNAKLFLRIYEIYSSDSMVDAFTWFYKGFQAKTLEDYEKQYPLGSEGRKYFNRIGNFFDLLGTFLEKKFLDKNLIIEFCPDDVKSFWEKLKPIVFQMRKKWKDPKLWAGIETLNREILKWLKKMEN